MATGLRNGRIRLWELSSGRLLSTLKGHTQSVRSIDGTWDTKRLISAGWDGQILIWDISSAVALLGGKKPKVKAEENLPTSKVITTSNGATIRLTFRTKVSDEEIQAALREALKEFDK